MGRIRFMVIGAVIGVAWAASLRGFMQQLAGPDSTFTFAGTFGIIIPTGIIVGALLGWAEYQRRSGHQYQLLIGAPLLIGIIPDVFTDSLDPGPIGLALLAMIGGYAISGRGPRWTRIVAGIVNLSGIAVTFSRPSLIPTSAHHPARRLVRHPGVIAGPGSRPGLRHSDVPSRAPRHNRAGPDPAGPCLDRGDLRCVTAPWAYSCSSPECCSSPP